MVSVALIEPVGSHGGMNYYDSGLMGGLIRQGIYGKWYTCDKSEICGNTNFEIVKSFVGIWGGDPGWIRGIRYVRGLIKSLLDARQSKLTIAHYHLFHIGILELLGVLFARLFGLQVILTVHDVEAFRPGAHSEQLRKITYCLASQIIVHNIVSKAELLKLNPEVSLKTHVIPHGSYIGLMPEKIDKDTARKRLNLPQEPRIILFFGQIKDVKGLDLLIDAFSKSYLSYAPVKLLIAGKVWKDDFSRYEQLIAARDLGKNCLLDIRYIPDEEVNAFYSSADLIVLPYRKIYQSGVLLMAMSYGTPVLASDLPGMKEIIQDGSNGYLFSANNAESLATRLTEILRDEPSMASVVRNASRDMITRFSWDSIATETIAVYQNSLIKRN